MVSSMKAIGEAAPGMCFDNGFLSGVYEDYLQSPEAASHTLVSEVALSLDIAGLVCKIAICLDPKQAIPSECQLVRHATYGLCWSG